ADYFTFSKKDRIAVFLLVIVVGALVALPALLPTPPPALAPLPDSVLRRAPDSSRYRQPYDRGRANYPDRPGYASRREEPEAGRDAWRKAPLFEFDPNQLDAAGWSRLGLPARTIATILKYRERGGRFRRPEDLGKIWSLPPGFVERVLPSVRIAPAAEGPGGGQRYPPFTRETRTPVLLSINEADSVAWEGLPGIGAKLAGRIIRYRERLGGFVSVDQVGETWGLPDSTFRQIRTRLELKSSGQAIRKFNLNNATRDELKVHPYIRWNLANTLVEYRERHGSYRSTDDLRKVLLLPDSLLQKILPYIDLR
ncbi:MAG: hypothetical protein EOO15_18485, partial [Chitinophagaceae bacterium]